MDIRASLLVAALAASAAPSLAQESGGDPSGGSAGARVELPIVGEVPVPGFIAGLLGLGGSDAKAGQSGGSEGSSGGQANLPAVVFEVAEEEPVGDAYRFLGRITPIERVAVQARISGFIESVEFEGGDNVESGDLLFQIQRAQYEAALEAAQAQLAGADAAFRETQRQAERQRELRESGTVSQANLEDALASLESARAQRLQAEAAVTQAELDLSYTSIEAAIDGQMSAPDITRGNYVSAQSGELAELVQLDPVWGVFALGENRLATWRQIGMGGTGTDGSTESDRISADGYTLSLVLPDGSVYTRDGTFDFIGNSVDPQTGTVAVRVRFENPDGLLLPNQNVTLRVAESDPPVRPVVPQAAVQLGRDGSAVWVVGDGDAASRVPVETASGPRPGTVSITRGLSGGERVVVRGALSLEEGQTVDPRRAGDTGNAGAPASGGGGGDGGEQSSGGSEGSSE